MVNDGIERVVAWKCPFCGSLSLEFELIESCRAQCSRVLALSTFNVGDSVSLLRANDGQVFTVVEVRVRRRNGGMPGIVYVCESAQGKKEVFPVRIIVRAKVDAAQEVGNGEKR